MTTWITTREAAESRGYSPDWINKLCRAGLIKSRMFGRTRQVNVASLAEYKPNRAGRPGRVDKAAVRADLDAGMSYEGVARAHDISTSYARKIEKEVH